MTYFWHLSSKAKRNSWKIPLPRDIGALIRVPDDPLSYSQNCTCYFRCLVTYFRNSVINCLGDVRNVARGYEGLWSFKGGLFVRKLGGEGRGRRRCKNKQSALVHEQNWEAVIMYGETVFEPQKEAIRRIIITRSRIFTQIEKQLSCMVKPVFEPEEEAIRRIIIDR